MKILPPTTTKKENKNEQKHQFRPVERLQLANVAV